jgi:hypothetical protein
MSDRIAVLETERQSMRKAMEDLREELRVLTNGLDNFEVSGDCPCHFKSSHR